MQELLQDINALRRGIEALNKRSLEQGKPVSRAELDEVLAKVKQEVRFTIDYKGIAEAIQPHLATPAKVETTLATGAKQLEQVVSQIPKEVPVVGQVWGFTDWRLMLGVAVLLLGLTAATMYSWQSKSLAEARSTTLNQYAVAYRDSLQQERAQNDWLITGYLRLNKASPAQARKHFGQLTK